MAYTSQQKRIARRIIRVGQKRGESRKEIRSALATALVEANLTNPAGGEGTSAGWRQEINTYGSVRKRRNVAGAANRYYDETSALNDGRGMGVGELSQAVQRSAYPDRYAGRVRQATDLLNAYNRGEIGGTRMKFKRVKTPGVDNSGTRTELLQNYVQNKHAPDALLSLGLGLQNAQDVPGSTSVVGQRVPGADVNLANTPHSVNRMLRIAKAWDKKKVPYQWGGGHGSAPAKPGQAVDCSGYVSAILGIKPTVSGNLAKWGKPGRGKNVTVWANSGHVLIQIGKRWFGTSSSNPSGGAGEISKPTDSYLSQFTPRHPGRK